MKQVWVCEQLCRRALGGNFAFFHDDYLVCQVDEVHGVRHQDSCLVFQDALENLLVDLFTSLRVKGGDGIVHDDDVGALVHGSGQADSCLLAARQIDTLLTDLSLVTGGHEPKIRLKLASQHSLNVLALLEL